MDRTDRLRRRGRYVHKRVELRANIGSGRWLKPCPDVGRRIYHLTGQYEAHRLMQTRVRVALQGDGKHQSIKRG